VKRLILARNAPCTCISRISLERRENRAPATFYAVIDSLPRAHSCISPYLLRPSQSSLPPSLSFFLLPSPLSLLSPPPSLSFILFPLCFLCPPFSPPPPSLATSLFLFSLPPLPSLVLRLLLPFPLSYLPGPAPRRELPLSSLSRAFPGPPGSLISSQSCRT
jgi:hypothetical protein